MAKFTKERGSHPLLPLQFAEEPVLSLSDGRLLICLTGCIAAEVCDLRLERVGMDVLAAIILKVGFDGPMNQAIRIFISQLVALHMSNMKDLEGDVL